MKATGKKMGRPKAENPKATRYYVRVDAETERKLTEYCEQHQVTVAAAIRRGIDLLLEQK